MRIKNVLLAAGILAGGIVVGGACNTFAMETDSDGKEWFSYEEAVELKDEIVEKEEELCGDDFECKEIYFRNNETNQEFKLASRISDGVFDVSYFDFNNNRIGIFVYDGGESLCPGWGGMGMMGEIERVVVAWFDSYEDFERADKDELYAGEEVKGAHIVYFGTKGVKGEDWLKNGQETIIRIEKDFKEIGEKYFFILPFTEDKALLTEMHFDFWHNSFEKCAEMGKACKKKISKKNGSNMYEVVDAKEYDDKEEEIDDEEGSEDKTEDKESGEETGEGKEEFNENIEEDSKEKSEFEEMTTEENEGEFKELAEVEGGRGSEENAEKEVYKKFVQEDTGVEVAKNEVKKVATSRSAVNNAVVTPALLAVESDNNDNGDNNSSDSSADDNGDSNDKNGKVDEKVVTPEAGGGDENRIWMIFAVLGAIFVGLGWLFFIIFRKKDKDESEK